jgi:nuclear transport factor 2 (NTF2) superfamily protein
MPAPENGAFGMNHRQLTQYDGKAPFNVLAAEDAWKTLDIASVLLTYTGQSCRRNRNE